MIRLPTLALLAVYLVVACGSASDSHAKAPIASPTSQISSTTPSPSGTSGSPSARATAAPSRPAPSTHLPEPAVVSPPPGIMSRLPTTRRVVALTFDAGAGTQGVDSILTALAREGVVATFFVTGQFVAAAPGLARRMDAAGVVGNHTVDHPHLTTLADSRVSAEVLDAAQTITTVTGRSPKPWFRFPYGESDLRTRRLVASLGYRGVGWTVDTLGWRGRAAGTAADVTRRVVTALSPGEIVLMHVGANPDDGTTYDADALPQVIAAVRAAGYGFTTVGGD